MKLDESGWNWMKLDEIGWNWMKLDEIGWNCHYHLTPYVKFEAQIGTVKFVA
jgi:hypothetical protein